jgi:hypothetical protein
MNHHTMSVGSWLSLSVPSVACGTTDIAELGVFQHEVEVDASSQVGTPDVEEPAEDAGNTHIPEPPSRYGPPCVPHGCLATSDISTKVPGLECISLQAHAAGDTNAPYGVPVLPEQYVKFTARMPWSGTRYLRSVTPIIEAAAVLHDMRLYEHQGALPEGVAENVDTPRELHWLMSWWPGTQDLTLDPAVGIPLESGAWFTLEAHYNHVISDGRQFSDRSGFEVCTTAEAPDYLVSFSRLGTETIAGTTAEGVCRAENEMRSYVLAVQPALNLYGTRVELTRQSAWSVSATYDAPFAFSDSRIEAVADYVDPGDTLTTRCTYSRAVTFGPGIYDGVCDLYVLHWPARSLVSGGDVQRDSCLR